MMIEQARVLIVEDDPVMQAYVVNSLRRLGIEQIKVASDGASALTSLLAFRPSVVLTDIHMKPMDGLEFVQRLRRHHDPEVQKLPVIFLTADSSSSTLGEAVPLGTVGYIVKPPRLETLKAKIAMTLC